MLPKSFYHENKVMWCNVLEVLIKLAEIMQQSYEPPDTKSLKNLRMPWKSYWNNHCYCYDQLPQQPLTIKLPVSFSIFFKIKRELRVK